jgi:predicted RNase H-like HicB family nuclease
MMFQVTMETSEDGWTVAECPALPGCVKNESPHA